MENIFVYVKIHSLFFIGKYKFFQNDAIYLFPVYLLYNVRILHIAN